jgi:hypothetical protein
MQPDQGQMIVPWSRQPIVCDQSHDFTVLKNSEADPTIHEIKFEPHIKTLKLEKKPKRK